MADHLKSSEQYALHNCEAYIDILAINSQNIQGAPKKHKNQVFMIFRFCKKKRFAELTFSSPSKMFFSPARWRDSKVKNILGGEEKVRVAKPFLLQTKCKAGPATHRGESEEIW